MSQPLIQNFKSGMATPNLTMAVTTTLSPTMISKVTVTIVGTGHCDLIKLLVFLCSSKGGFLLLVLSSSCPLFSLFVV